MPGIYRGYGMARKRQQQNGNGSSLGFEEKLWQAADKLRGHMDAAEYKHVVLGLVFLKYISDAFEEHRQKLLATPGADPVGGGPVEPRDAQTGWLQVD
jgi:type I restriction enzyme M protein